MAFEAMQGTPGSGGITMTALYPNPVAALAGAGTRYLPFEAGPQVGAGYGGGQLGQPVLAPYQTTPDVEVRAATDFMQDASADLIRKLYQYLEANGEQHPQLADVMSMVQRAAELFGAHDYTGAFSQAYQGYRAITIVRASVPALPGL